MAGRSAILNTAPTMFDAAAEIEKLARAIWEKSRGEDCPPEAIPAPEDLAAWLPDCPDETGAEAGERLACVVRFATGREKDRLEAGAGAGAGKPKAEDEAGDVFPPLAGKPWAKDVFTLLALMPWADAGRWRWVAAPGETGPALRAACDFAPVSLAASCELAEIHHAWQSMPRAGRPPHPLAPLVAAWQGGERSKYARTETRRDTRILPAVRWSEAPERERGRLIGGVAPRRSPAELPLFPDLAPERLQFSTQE